MSQVFFTPLFTALDSNGDPISGAKLFIYEAGTTTKLTTYSDSALTTANANPLVADSAGRFSAVYGSPDDYKFVLTTADDTDPPTAPIETVDNYTITATSSFSGGINSSGFTQHVANAQTGVSYTILDGDRAKSLTFSNASPIAVTLPQANSTTFTDGWYVFVYNNGTGTATITPTTSTINGESTLALLAKQSCVIISDGSNYIASQLSIGGFTANKRGALLVQNGDDNNIELITSQGTSGQVLLSNGADALPSWGGESLQLIKEVTASADSEITLIDGTAGVVLDDTYLRYVIQFENLVPGTDNTELFLNISEDGGSTYLSNLERHSVQFVTSSTSYDFGSSTSIVLAPVLGTGTNESASGTIVLYNPGASSTLKRGEYNSLSIDHSPTRRILYGHFDTNSTNAYNAIKILFSSGTISGKVTMWGMK